MTIPLGKGLELEHITFGPGFEANRSESVIVESTTCDARLQKTGIKTSLEWDMDNPLGQTPCPYDKNRQKNIFYFRVLSYRGYTYTPPEQSGSILFI